MTFESQSHKLGAKGWPKTLHLMRGDILRVSGNSTQNGVLVSLLIAGGKGSSSTTDVAWNLNWVTGEGRNSYTVRLIRKAGAAPEELLAETTVVLHDKPAVRLEPVPSDNLFVRTFALQTELDVKPEQVEWIVDDKPAGFESIAKQQCGLLLNGLAPGNHRLSGRVRFADNQGSLAFQPVDISIADVARVAVLPDRPVIHLTDDPNVAEIQVRVEPLVLVPPKAVLQIKVNDEFQTVPASDPVWRMKTSTVSNQAFTVQPFVVEDGKTRQGLARTFTTRRDLAKEISLAKARVAAVRTDAIDEYLRGIAGAADARRNLDIATRTLAQVEAAIAQCNQITLPTYLPANAAKALGNLNGNRREMLALSKKFLQREIVFWRSASTETSGLAKRMPLLLAARDIPEPPATALRNRSTPEPPPTRPCSMRWTRRPRRFPDALVGLAARRPAEFIRSREVPEP